MNDPGDTDITPEELVAIAARAGIAIASDEIERMIEGYRGLQTLLDRIAMDLPPAAEPAFAFVGEGSRITG